MVKMIVRMPLKDHHVGFLNVQNDCYNEFMDCHQDGQEGFHDCKNDRQDSQNGHNGQISYQGDVQNGCKLFLPAELCQANILWTAFILHHLYLQFVQP